MVRIALGCGRERGNGRVIGGGKRESVERTIGRRMRHGKVGVGWALGERRGHGKIAGVGAGVGGLVA